MKKTMLSLALVAASASAGFAQSAALSTTGTHSINLTIQDQIALTLSATGASGTWGTSATDYGNKQIGGGTMQVTSNRNYDVTAAIAGSSTSGSNFDYTNPANLYSSGTNASTNIPLSALKLTVGNGSMITGSSNAAPIGGTVASGTRGMSGTANINYDFNPGYAYDGGVYVATVTYTATQK